LIFDLFFMTHIPVLLKEVLKYLNPKANENFVDCTIGEGGHAAAILEKIKPNGRLLGIDLNIDLLKVAEVKSQKHVLESRRGAKVKNRLVLIRDNFTNLKKIIKENNFKPVQGILLDLGFSSWQLEKSGRGFSFKKNEPLIMRYERKIKNQKSKLYPFLNLLPFVERRKMGERYAPENLTAEYIVNVWPEKELVKIFQDYGEERFSRRIAKKICQQRKIKAIKTTFQLVEIIRQAIPSRFRHQRIHCATRVFQALRIVVNDELNNLKKVLPQAIEILEPSGKIAVISFHSLEDRIVKHFFKEQSKIGKLKIVTKKPVIPSFEEIKKNPRARSAKMRVATKVK